MQIVSTLVFHARLRPRRNAFRYRLRYIAVPLAEWSSAARRRMFSFDRGNILSLQSRDYGDGRTPLRDWIAGVCSTFGVTEANGEVVLLTLPRLFGYVFNPVSFWFCLDQEGRLRAALAEVRNTFGERHCYFCFHADHRPITGEEDLVVQKGFHVSPFMEVKGSYRFRFVYETGRLNIKIDLHDGEGLILATSMIGSPRPATTLELLKTAVLNPLQSLKVVFFIHVQALKLYLKGVRHYRKPEAPQTSVSH
jgi:DUF1365 family protein